MFSNSFFLQGNLTPLQPVLPSTSTAAVSQCCLQRGKAGIHHCPGARAGHSKATAAHTWNSCPDTALGPWIREESPSFIPRDWKKYHLYLPCSYSLGICMWEFLQAEQESDGSLLWTYSTIPVLIPVPMLAGDVPVQEQWCYTAPCPTALYSSV